jgi:hypothetical protein
MTSCLCRGAWVVCLLLMNLNAVLPEAKPGACYGNAPCCRSKASLWKRLNVLRGGYNVINPDWAEKMGMDPEFAYRPRGSMVPENTLYIGNLDEQVGAGYARRNARIFCLVPCAGQIFFLS